MSIWTGYFEKSFGFDELVLHMVEYFQHKDRKRWCFLWNFMH